MAFISTVKAMPAPTAATLAKSISVNSYMEDQAGMLLQLQLNATELRNKINNMIQSTDSADPNLATLQALYAQLA